MVQTAGVKTVGAGQMSTTSAVRLVGLVGSLWAKAGQARKASRPAGASSGRSGGNPQRGSCPAPLAAARAKVGGAEGLGRLDARRAFRFRNNFLK